MSDFEQYLIDSFGETWERSGIMDAHNAALVAERERYERLLDLAGAQNMGIDNLSKLDDLQQQLAAEREKNKRAGTFNELVHTNQQLREQLAAAIEARQALERLLEGVEIPFNIHSDICAALAKIEQLSRSDTTSDANNRPASA
jgi:hypothetical protein